MLGLWLVGAAAAQSPFQSIPAAPSDFLTFRLPLGNFTAKVIHGRTWRAADLQGKFTLIDVWSVSCGPCRREHPELQRFYEKASASNRIQVLTCALDSEAAPVAKYMREARYTFPVIAGAQSFPDLCPADRGSPSHMVIDPQGRRSEPFRAWTFGRILFEIERAAGVN